LCATQIVTAPHTFLHILIINPQTCLSILLLIYILLVVTY